MLARLADRLTALFRATAPDPFVLAIFLTALTFALGVFFGHAFDPDGPPRALQMLDWWQAGMWPSGLLAFALQMCLILVTGHALASAPPVERALRAVSSLPRTGRQAVAMTSLIAIAAGLINWGLGLIVGAILARDVGRAMRARGVPVPYPLLAAAGYTSLLCWHGGLSGSAPLQAAKRDDLVNLIGADLAAHVGDLPVTSTLFTHWNLVITGGLFVLIPLLLAALCPRPGQPCCGLDDPIPTPPPAPNLPRPSTLPEFLDRSPLTVWLIALPAIIWLARAFAQSGLAALNLDTANLAFFALGLILHGSAARYMDAATEAAKGCAGIIVQFPLYFGIMGMMRSSGLGADLSRWFADAAGGNDGALAVMTFLSAGLVNLFVPSGGGQWAIQAPIALQAAVDSGAQPARMVMAVAYGDQWTNMIQPFWALPLLGVTGVKARDIVGYTAVALVAAGVWIGLWLAIL